MDFDGWKRRPDPVSLSALLEAVEPRVYRICRRIVRDNHDAEEAKQEVLLEIASGLDAVVDGAHFERWVGKVAFRTALDRRRMRLRRIAREHESAGRTPNGAAHDDALHESMSRLDDEDRDLLIERYFDRRTLLEMGRRRGISAVAVRKRIAGAQDRLKRMLGCGVPVALVFGASAVKAKTAAVLAMVLIPLFLGGIWLAASRQGRNGAPVATSPAKSGSLLAANESGTKAGRNPAPSEGEVSEAKLSASDGRREAFLQKLDRYRRMCDRLRECNREMGDTWVEEIRREIQQLEKDMPVLCGELRKEAPEFPEECLAFFLSIDWDSGKSVIGWLLQPSIEAELQANNSRAGPILKALLPLAHGSRKDRNFLVRLAEDLKVGSWDLAEICLASLEDPDKDLRYSAMAAFARQGMRGNLGDFVAEHIARFQALALSGTQDRPAVFAFLALSAVGDKETDEFILRQFEATASLPESWCRGAAMARIGPRILPAQEARVVDSLRRVLDLSSADLAYVHWIELALQLTAANSVEILKFAATRIPPNQEVLAEGLEGLVRCVEAGKTQDALREIARLRWEHGAVGQWAITGAARKVLTGWTWK